MPGTKVNTLQEKKKEKGASLGMMDHRTRVSSNTMKSMVLVSTCGRMVVVSKASGRSPECMDLEPFLGVTAECMQINTINIWIK